jgi:hypothetical protein
MLYYGADHSRSQVADEVRQAVRDWIVAPLTAGLLLPAATA